MEKLPRVEAPRLAPSEEDLPYPMMDLVGIRLTSRKRTKCPFKDLNNLVEPMENPLGVLPG